MPATMTKKFTPEIDAQLYEEMVAVAKQNGQPQRDVLERALEFYLHNVVPSQRRSVRKCWKLPVAPTSSTGNCTRSWPTPSKWPSVSTSR